MAGKDFGSIVYRYDENQNMVWECLAYEFNKCGRVMADNIAYAKFRKTLLFW